MDPGITPDNTPKFGNPPVSEVVCGVLFSTPNRLKMATVGAFWESLKGDFPTLEEGPAFPPQIEGPPHAPPQMRINFGGLPDLRVLLISADGRNMIQIQPDRFTFNWKRVSAEDKYPSYLALMKSFEFHFASFSDFLGKIGAGKPTFLQYELSYVNLIGPDNGLNDVGAGSILVDHLRDAKEGRFLPNPERFNWTSSYPLEEESGRLHIVAQGPLVLANASIFRLDFIARGIPKKEPEAQRGYWFDIAHNWITRGFADTTSPVLHSEKFWRRTQ